jgi:hypothetical protein
MGFHLIDLKPESGADLQDFIESLNSELGIKDEASKIASQNIGDIEQTLGSAFNVEIKPEEVTEVLDKDIDSHLLENVKGDLSSSILDQAFNEVFGSSAS